METSEWILAALAPLGIAVGVGDFPEGEPAARIAYVESDGPIGYLGAGAHVDRQTVRIVVRAAALNACVQQLRAIESALRAARRPNAALFRTGGMEDLGKDAEGRAQLAMKFKHYEQKD